MKTSKKITLGLLGSDFSLPFSVNFAAFADGPLPAVFAPSANWSVSGGVAVCNPTVGAEISPTNLDFESAPYTGWSQTNITAVSAADPRPGSAGVSSWLATATAANGLLGKTYAGTGFDFVRLVAWMKAGTAGARLRVNGGGVNGKFTSSTSWGQYTCNGFRTSAASIFANLRIDTSGGNASFDDASFVPITGVFNGVRFSRGSYITARANIRSSNTGNVVGMNGVFLGDSAVNPQNGLYASLVTSDSVSSNYVRLYKVLSNVVTALGSGLILVTFSNGAPLEIRRIADTTYQVFYNGLQVDSDFTITDTAVKDAEYAGFQSSGGAGQGVDAFFLLSS